MTTQERRTFVTLITSDSYLPGLQVLRKTLRTHSKYPLLVLASASLSKATLRRISSLDVDVRTVDDIAAPPESSRPDACWCSSQYTKLHIWSLTEFTTLVYIDADCVVCESIDELFDLDTEFAAAPDVFPPDRFNAGVLVIRPSLETFQKLTGLISTTPSYDGGDTGFLNAVFSDWYTSDSVQRLPFRYNAQRTMHWFTRRRPGYWQAVQPVKVIHFSSSPKPWESNPLLGENVGELEQLWWDLFLSS